MSRFRKVLILLLFLVPASALAVTAGVEDAKSIARLYSAAFNLKPDIGGLNYWIGVYEAGESLPAIAGGFYNSPEFIGKYGTLSDQQYVEQLYRNVLGRAGEEEGVNFWTNHLSNGVSRAEILAEFASSPENIAKTADLFADMRLMNCQWSFGPEQHISGNTGCLVGLAASGVTYRTPTHQGVTGPGGDFHYEAGETVQFTLGDTLLGAVMGQEKVTLFDLAGSPVLTGLNIEWALEGYGPYGVQPGQPMPNGSIYIDEVVTPGSGWFPGSRNDPFFKLVNMAVFLQSLDDDADTENGISISTDVAALFEGVNLNLDQEWEEFLNEPALRHAIWRANNEQLFSKRHRIINPGPALQHLYQSLGVNARKFAVSREQWDLGPGEPNPNTQYQYDADGNTTRVEYHESDGRADEILTRQYDAEGNLTRQSADNNADGIPDEIVVLKYDQNGNPPRMELDSNADGLTDYSEYWFYESEGNATLVREGRREFPRWTFEGRSIEREIYTGGNLTRIEFDNEDDGIIERTHTFEYDAQGHLTRFEGDLPSELTVWNYDAEGNLTSYVGETLTRNWRYDDNGNVTYFEEDRASDGSPDIVYRYLYDAEGNLTQVDHWNDIFNNGTEVETDTYLLTYNDKGNLTQLDRNAEAYQYFFDADEKLTRVEITTKPGILQTALYEYDPNGNLILFQEGSMSGELRTWQYSPDGRSIRYEFRYDRDDLSPELIREYESAGWGSLYSVKLYY